MAAQLDPEQQAAATTAVMRALVREQQLLEAVAPLDELLSEHELEPIGHDLGRALGRVRHNLQRIGRALAPEAAVAATEATSTPDGD